MHELRDFVLENLEKGFHNGTWSGEEINIMAANYNLRGVFGKADVDYIASITSNTDAKQEEKE